MYEKYNRLTIIDEPFTVIKSKKPSLKCQKTIFYRKFVKVRCDCGIEKIVSFFSLKRGLVKSCGCLNLERIASINATKKLNLNKDTIINDYKNKIDLKIIAKKNKTSVRRISKILRDNGFEIRKLGKNNKTYKGYEDISGYFWSKILNSAKTRNLEFTITKEYIWNLYLKQNKKCVYSNIDLYFSDSVKDFITKHTASLDRIDSSKGYIEGNVQWIHKKINMMKQSISENEFINLCTLIVKNKNPNMTLLES